MSKPNVTREEAERYAKEHHVSLIEAKEALEKIKKPQEPISNVIFVYDKAGFVIEKKEKKGFDAFEYFKRRRILTEAKVGRIQPYLNDCINESRTRALYYRAILDDLVKLERDKTAKQLTDEENAQAKMAIKKLKPKEYIPTVENWFIRNGHESKLRNLMKALGDVEGLIDEPQEVVEKFCYHCMEVAEMLKDEDMCDHCKYEEFKQRKANRLTKKNDSRTSSNEDSSNSNNEDSHYSKYGGYNGYNDDTIDSAFEGDPSLTWNID